MSGFKPYPAYKESGVEWLGEVPEHWALHKLKYIAGFSGGGTPSRENLTYWNGDIPWVSPKDMKFEVIVGAEENITSEGLQNSTASLVSPGGLLIVVRSGILKHTIPVAINNVEVALNQDMKALRFNPKLALFDFFFRWIQGFNNQLLHAWLKQGATVESIEQEYLADTTVPMPGISEQRMILDFVDHATARIDALIEEQQRLIELLKEKRQAVISHAVTKGLDPTVRMKNSGVEWLGEVPAHWAINTVRRCLVEHRQGYYSSAPYVEDGVKLLRITDIKSLGHIDVSNCPRVEDVAELDNFLLKSGDVVFARTGGAGSFGIVSEIEEKLAYASYLIRFRFDLARLSPQFMRYIFISDNFQVSVRANIHGGVNQNIHAEDIKNVFICIPPLEEQNNILLFLNSQCDLYNRLIEEAFLAVDLLQERRSALISAAVTGKIDVRGWQPPASAQAPETEVAEAV